MSRRNVDKHFLRPLLLLATFLLCGFLFFASWSPSSSSSPSSDTSHRETLSDKELEMKERLERMKRVCARYGDDVRWMNADDNATVSRENFALRSGSGFGLCLNSKAATTTLRSYLKGLRRDRSDDAFRLARPDGKIPLGPLMSHFRKREVFTASFVRHPFDRLVSAFKNKMLGLGPGGYGGVPKDLVEEVDGDFVRFVDHVLRCADELGCARRRDRRCDLNVHWAPFQGRCAYCDVAYSAVGRTEDLESDLEYVAAKAGVPELGRRRGSRHLKRSSFPKGPKPSQSIKNVEGYMALLDLSRRRRLYELYRLDFELFGYSAEKYLS